MVTKEQAEAGGTFYHRRLRNADGSPLRCRSNGKLKTWKREPSRWQLPVKYGLRDCFYLSPDNAENWFACEEDAANVA